MNALAITGLTIRRGNKRAVENLSFQLVPGKVTALLGPNGAGKSSLVLALAGVLPAEAGSVRIGSREMLGRTPDVIRKAGLAAVPEGHRVLSGLSVEDNLAVAGCLHESREQASSLRDVYQIFPELAERRHQKAGSMSGGQQQMLALAQALMSRPTFILADEMSLGLAPLIVKRLMGVIDGLARRGTGILLIEQFTTLALARADDALVLSQGRVQYHGAPQRLIDEPDILRRAYLAGRDVT